MLCLKCQCQTATKKHKVIISKNNRSMIAGRCQNCNTKKQQFVRKEKILEVMNDDSRSDEEYDDEMLSDDE